MNRMVDWIVRVVQDLWCRIRGGADSKLETAVIREEVTDELTALSAGDVFAFRAAASLTWQATGLSESELHEATQRYGHAVRSQISDLLSRQAHSYEPYCAYELERRLESLLAEQELTYDLHGSTVRCVPRVRVALDQDVRKAIRGPLLDRMVIAIQHENGMRRADQVDAQTRHWSEVLAKLHEDPLVTAAARLTDEQFSQVVDNLTDTKAHEMSELRELLKKGLVDGPPEVGGYEWTRAFDQLLRALEQRIGPEAPDDMANQPSGTRQPST